MSSQNLGKQDRISQREEKRSKAEEIPGKNSIEPVYSEEVCKVCIFTVRKMDHRGSPAFKKTISIALKQMSDWLFRNDAKPIGVFFFIAYLC